MRESSVSSLFLCFFLLLSSALDLIEESKCESAIKTRERPPGHQISNRNEMWCHKDNTTEIKNHRDSNNSARSHCSARSFGIGKLQNWDNRQNWSEVRASKLKLRRQPPSRCLVFSRGDGRETSRRWKRHIASPPWTLRGIWIINIPRRAVYRHPFCCHLQQCRNVYNAQAWKCCRKGKMSKAGKTAGVKRPMNSFMVGGNFMNGRLKASARMCWQVSLCHAYTLPVGSTSASTCNTVCNKNDNIITTTIHNPYTVRALWNRSGERSTDRSCERNTQHSPMRISPSCSGRNGRAWMQRTSYHSNCLRRSRMASEGTHLVSEGV